MSDTGKERPRSAHRILIVDDDAQQIALLRRVLERNGFEKIETTSDSRRVVDIVSARPPDVVVLDVHMPYLDGFGVLSAIARNGVQRLSPAVLAVSSDDSPQTRRAMFSGGASDFVARPYDGTEIALRIGRLARTVRAQRDVLSQCDELTHRLEELSVSVKTLTRR